MQQPGPLAPFALTVLDAFKTIGDGIITILPAIIAAAIVLILGWLAAAGVAKLVKKGIQLTKIDDVIDRAGLDRFLSDVGIDFNLSNIIAWLVKWFLIIVVLIAVANILKLDELTGFLKEVALYIPNIIVAVVVLLVGFVLGNFTHKVVTKTVEASKLNATAGLLATLSKAAIIVFALITALYQLGVGRELIQTLFTGFVGMIALAGGLAFGLGGKDAAKDTIDKVRQEIK